MPAGNPRQSMSTLADIFLDAALCLDKLEAGVRSDSLDEALLVITAELSSWGLDSVAAFQRTSIFVPSVCWEILRVRDGEERWPRRPGTTVTEVYYAMHGEYQNLLNILSHRDDGDIGQAKDFCLFLNQAALQAFVWGQIHRRGLAA